MKDNYGNRYRFYEIIQAHKNGEDLSQFTPKNKPEEDLIAELTGAAGGSTGPSNMPVYAGNNPELPNLYFGQFINSDMKVKVDFVKLAKFFNLYDDTVFSTITDSGWNNVTGGFELWVEPCFINVAFKQEDSNSDDFAKEIVIALYTRFTNDGDESHIEYYLVGDGDIPNLGDNAFINLPLIQDGQTRREYFDSLGIVELSLSELSKVTEYVSLACLQNIYIACYKRDGEFTTTVVDTTTTDLNETPIDFIWFE